MEQHIAGSVDSVLNSFSTELFDGLALAMRPIVGGIDYLRYMRKSYLVQKEIDKLSKLDYETRELLLDSLTDLVVGKHYDKNFKKSMETKLSELDEISEIFDQLQNQLDTIDKKQMMQILRLSLTKFNGKIVSIRAEINLKMWEKGEDISQLLLFDQLFYLMQESINEALKRGIEKIKEPDLWGLLIFSLLYIEAYRRNKVTYEDVQFYLSGLTVLRSIKQKNTGLYYNDRDVFDILSV
jgi:hypothetical protein